MKRRDRCRAGALAAWAAWVLVVAGPASANGPTDPGPAAFDVTGEVFLALSVADLDASAPIYLGISLGAILGPQLLTLDGGLDGAVLSVGGARLMSIVTESDTLRDFEDLIAALVGSKENFDRLVTVAQHIVDPVDPGTWSPHVLHDRLDDAPAPSVLVQVGLSDEVVPPASGHALARALNVPHLEPVAEPVELLETIAEAPVIANGPDSSTVALFQFDEVTRNGSVGPAYHVATPTSDEGRLQLLTFLRSWTESGIAEVVNPYDETGSR